MVSNAQYWGSRSPQGDQVYFGHVFMINAFQLRLYLEHVGFEVIDVDTTRYSMNALLLAPLLYPAVWISTKHLLAARRSKLTPIMRRNYLKQILKPHVLFGKKLIMVARKVAGSIH